MKLIIELNSKGDELIATSIEKDGETVAWNDLTFLEQIGACAAYLTCFRFYSQHLKKKK